MNLIKMPKARKGWNACLDWLPALWQGNQAVQREFSDNLFTQIL